MARPMPELAPVTSARWLTNSRGIGNAGDVGSDADGSGAGDGTGSGADDAGAPVGANSGMSASDMSGPEMLDPDMRDSVMAAFFKGVLPPDAVMSALPLEAPTISGAQKVTTRQAAHRSNNAPASRVFPRSGPGCTRHLGIRREGFGSRKQYVVQDVARRPRPR